MFVSSANKKNVSFFETFARSFMYSKNKRGPRTEPCGTPHLISKVSEVLPQTETYLHVKETLTNYFQFSIKVLRSESQVSFSTLL